MRLLWESVMSVCHECGSLLNTLGDGNPICGNCGTHSETTGKRYGGTLLGYPIIIDDNLEGAPRFELDPFEKYIVKFRLDSKSIAVAYQLMEWAADTSNAVMLSEINDYLCIFCEERSALSVDEIEHRHYCLHEKAKEVLDKKP